MRGLGARSRFAILIAGLLGVALPLAAAGQQTASLALAVETFDEAWRIIDETHFDTEFNGVDWDAVRDELRPRAEAAESMGELRGIISDMLGRLGQSHFALWPREMVAAMRDGDDDAEPPGGRSRRGAGRAGFSTVLADGAFLVAKVEPGGPAAAVGIRPGWVVRTVGDVDLAERLGMLEENLDAHETRVEAQSIVRYFLSGPIGSEVEIGFLDADDEPVDLTVERRQPQGRLAKFGNLPPMMVRLQHEVLRPDVGLAVGVIRFNLWLPIMAREFDAAIDTMRTADGVILDLRENPGGVGGMVMGIGGHFVPERVTLGTMRDRRNELRFVAIPRRVNTRSRPVEPYAGPLAILIDATTASTSEVFAGGMQSIGRARVFGQRSMGAVLPSLMDRLPNGDVLQHAIADFTVAETEERLEGRGVIPNEEITITRDDLLAGRDPILQAAMAWIARGAKRRNP